MSKINPPSLRWRPITEQPPDETIEVIDGFGNIATATPCYYDFRIIGGEVLRCSPYWDGSLLVDASCDLVSAIKGSIIGWRTIKKM